MRWNLIQRMLAPFVRVCFLAFCNLAYASHYTTSFPSLLLLLPLNILDNKYTSSFFLTQRARTREKTKKQTNECEREEKQPEHKKQANKPANKHTNIPISLSHKICQWTHIEFLTFSILYALEVNCFVTSRSVIITKILNTVNQLSLAIDWTNRFVRVFFCFVAFFCYFLCSKNKNSINFLSLSFFSPHSLSANEQKYGRFDARVFANMCRLNKRISVSQNCWICCFCFRFSTFSVCVWCVLRKTRMIRTNINVRLCNGMDVRSSSTVRMCACGRHTEYAYELIHSLVCSHWSVYVCLFGVLSLLRVWCSCLLFGMQMA